MQTSDMTKTRKKNLIGIAKILAFVLVLAVLLQVLSAKVFTVGDAAKYNNKYSNAYSYMLEPKDTIQVAAFGNSDLYSAIAPTVAWQAAGVTSTNIASPLQSVRQSYLMLQHFLTVQHPDVVVVETDMLYEHQPDRYRDYSTEQEQKPIEKFFDKTDPDMVDDYIKNKLSIFVFHDKWKTPFKSKKSAERDLYSHGYHLSLKVKPFELTNHMAPSEYCDRIEYSEDHGMQDILALCKENNIKVLLMEVPSVNSWSYERSNAMREYAAENDADFLDFNLLWDELGIDENHDFRDNGNHMNYYGAQKISGYYGKYLAEHYGLEDRRGNPDYAFWDESVEQFEIAVQKDEEDKKNNPDKDEN